MAWEIYGAKAHFNKFSDEWDRLNEMLYQGHPYFDSRFIGTLLEYFSSGNEKLCLYRTGKRLSAALILENQKLGRWGTFRPAQLQATPLLLEDPRVIESLWSALPGWVWSIELYAIDPRYAPDFSNSPRPMISYPQAQTIGIVPEETFAGYWRSRPKKLAANISRYFRRVETDWTSPSLSTLRNPVEMGEAIVRYGELEGTGWKARAGTAVASDNRQGAFYREVLRRFADSGQAMIYELYFGAHLASSRLTINNGQMLVCLKTAYDESISRFAPGRLLLYRVIEEEFKKPERRTIEFYTNATSDQKEWATFVCAMQNLQLFRNHACASVFSFVRAWRRRVFKSADDKIPSAHTTGQKNVGSIADFESASYDLAGFSSEDDLEKSVAWFSILEQNVGYDDENRYYFVAERQVPKLILPVRIVNKGIVKKVEALSNYYTPLYTPLVREKTDFLDLESLINTIRNDRRPPDVMQFSPMDPDSQAFKALRNALKANDWIPFSYFCFGNWYLKVEGNWENYLKTRSGNLRSAIRRRCKRFFSEGGTLDIVTTMDDIERSIVDFENVYSASWKQPEPYPRFVPSLIRHLAEQGSLRLGFARLQGQVIAGQLWYVLQGKAYIYKVAYHDDFAAYSPGTVLTAHLLRHVIDIDRVKEVDFLIGDDSYKRIWMSHRRERHGIVAYNPGTLVGLALLAVEIAGRAWKSLRRRLAPSPTALTTKESFFSTNNCDNSRGITKNQ
ncbi:MAG TPA: GNAT family N-acetyltransferase [Accumulibacter sp.]|nr:GNAT family N-acetyltransferase [Accumulibacter sp.]HMX21889.1 GNAT family N-acetyltransferase [Accumulibacter sp.]HMY06459.1 GNAT family N-acetyltransferase [Accumulibacter sp.]HNC18359.1 GNAT family N-acetyltransferase [Accumulibacter sp.]HND80617.1 GNAT family N-acetyltransferase [Accumulibacter sp.]